MALAVVGADQSLDPGKRRHIVCNRGRRRLCSHDVEGVVLDEPRRLCRGTRETVYDYVSSLMSIGVGAPQGMFVPNILKITSAVKIHTIGMGQSFILQYKISSTSNSVFL